MTILTADDHPLVHAGLRVLFRKDATFIHVGEAHDGPDTLRQLRNLTPELVLLDLRMPGPAPNQLADLVRATSPEVKILIFSAWAEIEVLRGLRSTGICGYISKDEQPESVLQALRTIREGATWFSRSVAEKLLSLHLDPSGMGALTSREREVLALMSEGKCNHDIAVELGLAEQTVRNHATSIYAKLRVGSRAEAMLWARRYLRN
jgi:DNA-binding NarL/FixJ family response regulator